MSGSPGLEVAGCAGTGGTGGMVVGMDPTVAAVGGGGGGAAATGASAAGAGAAAALGAPAEESMKPQNKAQPSPGKEYRIFSI